MKTIETTDLNGVCGGAAGFVSPCFTLREKSILDATQDDLATAHVSCGLKMPSGADFQRAKERQY